MEPTNQNDNNIAKNPKRAYNPHQTNQQKTHYAKWDIFEALSDGQWHRNMELQATTKLNPFTLTKHLKQMTKDNIIDRKEDTESGKYPIPVLYKAPIELIDIVISNRSNKKFSEWIDEWVKNKMVQTILDPLVILESINNITQVGFIQLLQEMQRDKKINASQITFLEEILITNNYNHAIKELITATWQIIDEININQMLVFQAIRLKGVYAKTLKEYEKSETIVQNTELKEIYEQLTKEYEKQEVLQDYSI